MAKPIRQSWYAVESLDSRILRFTEAHVDSYAVGDIWLVRGSELDVAFDAGSGIVAAGPLVESIADKPVLCVTSTCSYDHAGGWHSFAERACHRLDAATLSDPGEENATVHIYLSEDRFSAHPRPGFSPSDYRMVAAEPTRLLDDGEIIDLGDRILEVLHTPGRSPGGLSLWEASSGILFTGEILYDGDHGPAWPPDDPSSYCTSLRRLRDLPVAIVHPGHYGSFDRDRMRTLIDEQLADLADVTSPAPTP